MTKFITNQNIEIKHELAGLGDRIVAFLIDVLIQGGFFFLIAIMLAGAGAFDSTVFLVILYIPLMFYTLVFETFGNGQTPGKKARNIKVVKLDGGSPAFINYLLRWIVRPVDIFLYGAVAMICIIMTKSGQRLGDILAGTTVARVRSKMTLDDVKSAQVEGHEVKYPQVKQLNDKQIELIRKALLMRRDGHSGEGVKELAAKLKELLKIETQMRDVQFLHILIKDYEALVSE